MLIEFDEFSDLWADYDGWKSFQYSTWTESSWQTNAISLRIFLIPSKAMEVRISNPVFGLTVHEPIHMYKQNARHLL